MTQPNMPSIKIDDGTIRLAINNDPNRVISFNPSDTEFAQRFYDLIGELESKLEGYEKQSEQIDTNIATDARGVPENVPARLALMRESAEYLREQIDLLFGNGTSATVFGKVNNLDLFRQFFEGVTPFIKNARADLISRYAITDSNVKRAVDNSAIAGLRRRSIKPKVKRKRK